MKVKVLVLAISDGRHADDVLFKSQLYFTVYVSLINNIGNLGWYFSRVLYRLKLYKLFSLLFVYIIQGKVSLKSFDYIFINEGDCSEYLIKYLLNKSNAKIVFQYWNTIDKTMGVSPKFICKYMNNPRIRFQSFDHLDSIKYHVHHNCQFAPYLSIPATSYIKKDKKAIFVGVDKNRLSKIVSVVKSLYQVGVSSLLYIFPDKGRIYSEEDRKYIYQGKTFDYIDIVNMLGECDIVIDIVQDGQGGMTWRPLEALFYQRKLITNFSNITCYDFYTPENIFIIGRDNISELGIFLEKPLKAIPKEIKEKYTFDGCMKNIISEFEKASM